MSNPTELSHAPERVTEGKDKKPSQSTGEAVQGMESRNTELRQQNQQAKQDRNQSLTEQLQKNGTAKIGVITKNFGQSIEITNGDQVVVKGRSKEEVAEVAGQAKRSGQEQAYKVKYGESPDAPVGQAKPADPPPAGSAEQTGKVVDYKSQEVLKGKSFALGMDYEDKPPPDTRTPLDKLGDFMQAAEKRAADPEGWKAWAQGEISKFKGIGAGLNEAKEETKAAVAAGWKALTDGTVVEFLSQPDAINAPVFKTVANAFDAMGKDPNAVNHAFEALGHVVMKASEGYSNLPDYEKGKVIGKVMFGMVNPEGSTEGAEAALKVADQVATHVDKAVWDTAAQAMKAAQEGAKTAPEVAQQTKQMLLDYLTGKGLNKQQFAAAGVPDGYFEGMQPSPVPKKGDNVVYSMADKGNEASGESLSKGTERESMPEKVTPPSERFVAQLKQAIEELSGGERGNLNFHEIEIKPVRRLTDVMPGKERLGAFYSPQDKTIYVPEEIMRLGKWVPNDDVPFALKHEVGHAFNAKAHKFGEYISNRRDFIDAYKADAQGVTPELLDTLQLSTKYKVIEEARDEVLSDMYAHASGLQSNNPYSQILKKCFPRCLKFAEDMPKW